MKFRLFCALFLLAAYLSAGDAPAQLKTPVTCGKLPTVIDESSGIIKSKRYPYNDFFWTHNDSGDSSRIFAVNSSGELLRTVNIPHAANVDWEEITIDEKGRLIICDIGDNHRNNNKGRREGVVLYRIPEPDALNVNEKVSKPEVFRFHYPKGEGPFDAEGVFTRAGNAYLFTKRIDGTTCYRLPMPEQAPTESVAMISAVSTKSFTVVTGAALSDDGKHLALINYITVAVIDLPDSLENLKPNAKGELPIFDFPRRSVNVFLGQTEAVCWDGEDLVLTTEGGDVFRCKK